MEELRGEKGDSVKGVEEIVFLLDLFLFFGGRVLF